MIFSQDKYNKKILLDEDYNNYQTMMEWEKPYMEYLVDNLKPFGDVLEIGYGLGYSANQIQKYNIKSHTLIECDENVIKSINNKNIKIIKGYWQEVFDKLNIYDCIFFDDAPNKKFHHQKRFNEFLLKILKHVKKGSKLTWYSDNLDLDVSNYPAQLSVKNFKTKIPQNCYYTSQKDNMIVPLLTFEDIDPSKI